MIKRIIRIGFVAALLLVLLLSLAQAIFMPTDINQFEVRQAEKLPPFTLSGFLDDSFQEGTESALADQVSFSTYFKRAYIELFSAINKLYDPLVGRIPDKYISYWKMELYNGQLVYHPEDMPDYTEGADKMISQYNAHMEALPEQEFFLYYVDKDMDINFETGEKNGLYDYICAGLNIPEENCGRFSVDSFYEYHAKYYFSDHHWNAEGSYEGYLDLHSLLKLEDEPLRPVDLVALPGTFYGTKSVNVGTTGFYDRPGAYVFQFEPMKIYVNGQQIPNYGAQEEILAGYPMTPSYSAFYGDDLGCVVFDTEREELDRLLIVSESYDNAVLKLLAGHFEQLHSVDTRYYAHQTGELFSLEDYVREHGIDKVLLMGASEFFTAIAIGEG